MWGPTIRSKCGSVNPMPDNVDSREKGLIQAEEVKHL